MHIFRPRTDLARVMAFLAPLIGASWIAISRLEDYRHDAIDVSTGTFLGLSTAYFSYRRHYPPLRTTRCDEPYPGPWDTAGIERQARSKEDEEQGHRHVLRTSMTSMDDSLEAAETHPLNDLRT